MARYFTILFLILSAVSLRAQETDYLTFIKAETKLEHLFDQLYSDTLSDVEGILAKIDENFSEALLTEGSMDFPWEGLDHIGVITSDDGKLRILNWHVQDDPDHYRYFGYMLVRTKKGKTRLYKLHDNGKNQRNLVELDQSTEEWYGKLYYQIVTKKYKRKTLYTLLGMDFNNSLSILKFVEVISMQRNQPRFEKKLVVKGTERMDRLVLEYSSRVSISVRFDEGTGMITFDHLVPFHPIYKGNFEFYGPDGSFDGLEFLSGSWYYREDIDARNLD